MSLPIAPATSMLSSSPPQNAPGGESAQARADEKASVRKMGMNWGDNALTAPHTAAKRAPTIDRSKVNPQIVEAADGMEAMFLDYLMKVMRQTVPKNDMDLESPATDIYRGMLDSEYAKTAAHAGGVGLSDTIIAYMAPESYTLPKGQMNAPTGEKARRTGGTQ
jgi:Rod binding domain-containing protein